MKYEYDLIDKIYHVVKLISIILIILSGFIIANRVIFEPLYQIIGFVPTVTIFIIHIISDLILLSSIIFITVFKFYMHKPIFSFGYHKPTDLFMHWIIPFLILSTGITGIIIWTPFRWILPSSMFNIIGDFIYLAKNLHLWQMYLIVISLTAYLLLKLFYNGWQIRK